MSEKSEFSVTSITDLLNGATSIYVMQKAFLDAFKEYGATCVIAECTETESRVTVYGAYGTNILSEVVYENGNVTKFSFNDQKND